MDEHNITAAAQACIRDALKSDKPYRSINESLATLKRHGWTEVERLYERGRLWLVSGDL